LLVAKSWNGTSVRKGDAAKRTLADGRTYGADQHICIASFFPVKATGGMGPSVPAIGTRCRRRTATAPVLLALNRKTPDEKLRKGAA